MENKKEMYIVKYNFGHSLENNVEILFVTENEKTAKNYVKKFNRILLKWKKYYDQFDNWFAGTNQHKFGRWCQLRMSDKCYYDKIEVR